MPITRPVWDRERLVRCRELVDAFHRPVRPRRRAARGIVDVHQHQLVCGGEIAFGAVVHGVDEVQALGIVVEDLAADAQRIALLDLAVVGDVRLDHEGHADLLARVVPAAAELGAQRVGRLVEGDDVEADIHVAVPVDPFGQHGRAVLVERRGKIEFGHGVGR
jgi:hypothetical protein